MAKDGLTVAVGGLIRESTRLDLRKVPLLGDVPVVGRLFTQEVQASVKKELVLLITAHVISTATEGEFKTRWRMKELSNHPYHCRIPHAPVSVTVDDPELYLDAETLP